MNSNDPWRRLAEAARRAPDSRDVTAPHGFAARVAARALAADRRPPSFLAHVSLRASLRALGAAAALAVIAAGAGYPAALRLLSEAPAPELSLAGGIPAPANSPAAAAAPAQAPAGAESPAADAAPGEDPVTDLVNIVS